ncbi:MAG: Uncharacterised protein [Cellvibrionales bacterium UBA7375]|nr:hypothetical protein [Porticoccaceae bacterium]MAW23924.1 hypothetical protein [Porticoccaceae bacterium]RPG83022.1 MAG: hypothetical protein CBC07_004515 [Cellvibrionales bacterium TMED47]RPG85105.1 MAG: hypothetical protein CBC07_000565 [Cellvibrionales bacterium TMED47]CAI8365738.1 MAG: Uncharacterised protein [Cellvibrionales bacterium UBA7375]
MTFEQLEDLFYELKIKASPSGFHGFLCGRLSCGTVQMEDLVKSSAEWLGLEGEAAKAAFSALETFYESTLSDLQDISFLFQPLLPDDELPIPERLISVGDWCCNYLSGLGEGMGAEFEVSEDAKEALQDIAAIGQISTDFDAQEENEEEGEKDYIELVEYIRIAVQLIFSDLDPMEKAKPEPTIH